MDNKHQTGKSLRSILICCEYICVCLWRALCLQTHTPHIDTAPTQTLTHNMRGTIWKFIITVVNHHGRIHKPSSQRQLVCRLVTKSCPTLCDLMDCSPPGSFVHWTAQARILKWIAISTSSCFEYEISFDRQFGNFPPISSKLNLNLLECGQYCSHFYFAGIRHYLLLRSVTKRKKMKSLDFCIWILRKKSVYLCIDN